jgi:hypothetical protein
MTFLIGLVLMLILGAYTISQKLSSIPVPVKTKACVRNKYEDAEF